MILPDAVDSDSFALIFEDELSPADAAVMETFVVPRYLTWFGELVLDMFLAGSAARVVHLGCRTGYPDLKVYQLMDSVTLVGADPSFSALELARNKAAALGEASIKYEVVKQLPTPFKPDQYSHALCIHPKAGAEARSALFQEMHRLLYFGGQALVALPLRGSFLEVADLLLEYALKFDDKELASAVQAEFAARPNIESLSEELEQAGFDDIDIEIRPHELTFDSGRAFLEDPVTRLLIVPEVKSWLGRDDFEVPLAYVRDAMDKYWSETTPALSVNVGCASARKQ